jgi:predicted house-cleaning noncanonical NTP pyrophosphatase (MazG superfamily)
LGGNTLNENASLKKTEYNKLIRDAVPEIMSAKGMQYEVDVMADEEYQQALRQKVLEEAKEVLDASSERNLITEMADLYEVMEALASFHNISEEDIRAEQQYRHAKRGGFERRLRLLWTQG